MYVFGFAAIVCYVVAYGFVWCVRVCCVLIVGAVLCVWACDLAFSSDCWWFEFVVLDGLGVFGFCVLLGCLCVVFIVGLFGGVAIAVKYF